MNRIFNEWARDWYQNECNNTIKARTQLWRNNQSPLLAHTHVTEAIFKAYMYERAESTRWIMNGPLEEIKHLLFIMLIYTQQLTNNHVFTWCCQAKRKKLFTKSKFSIYSIR